LTARPSSRADAKAGFSDPTLTCESGVAQRIKVTPGITGLLRPIAHIDGAVWHLDNPKKVENKVTHNGGALLFVR